jgi:hypothetical protein
MEENKISHKQVKKLLFLKIRFESKPEKGIIILAL